MNIQMYFNRFTLLCFIYLNFFFNSTFFLFYREEVNSVVVSVVMPVLLVLLLASVAAFFIWRKIKRDKLGRSGNSMHTTATKPEEENVELNEELVR